MRELGIYVHIPFCVKKCAYCDFLSAPAGEEEKAVYTERLCQEIREKSRGKGSRLVTSIFFGGGTPSVLSADQTERILDTLRKEFSVSEDAEITTELNPGTAGSRRTVQGAGEAAAERKEPSGAGEAVAERKEGSGAFPDRIGGEEKLKAYRRMGFNRLSIGLQSVSDEELALLGRIHTYRDFLETYREARRAGFTNINIDLMAALPGQTEESFVHTLREAAALKPEHLSVYSLIVEEGTPFYRRYGEDARRREEGETPLWLPSEEAERNMYAAAASLLEEAGYRHYEISNYAREGFICRHNDNCWLRKEYLGFGIGAASLYEEQRFSCHRDLKRYLRGDFTEENWETLTVQEQMEETMFLGLRRMAGVSEAAFLEKFGVPFDAVYGREAARFEKEGLLLRQDGRVFLTAKGIDISNYVMAGFLKD